MNARIKEIEIQSVFFNEETQTWEFDREKFAELLISAVIAEVRDEVQYQLDWTLADIVTERVKKEFGVK